MHKKKTRKVQLKSALQPLGASGMFFYRYLEDLPERHFPQETNFSKAFGLLLLVFKRESCTYKTL